MAALWRGLLSTRAAAMRGSGLRGRETLVCRRWLSVSSARQAGVDPAEEAVFSQDHVEMREVRDSRSASRSSLSLSLSLSFCQALNKFIEKEINPFVDEWELAKSFPSHEV